IEKEDELTTLKVAFDGEEEDLEGFKDKVSHLINETPINVYEENYNYNDFSLPAINIDENWVLASPDEEIREQNYTGNAVRIVSDKGCPLDSCRISW
ncbi:MAG: hypothetical protein HUK15_08555, partial [Bacteroidales bacterium]|nr:hypothetical protein [Bacteroidales bacterium]